LAPRFCLAIASSFLFAGCAQTFAQSPGGLNAPAPNISADYLTKSNRDKIAFGEAAAIPSGYYEMCVAQPGLCRTHRGRLATTRDGSVVVSGSTMAQLSSVNASVNASIHPAYRSDWTPGRDTGDCKDFAMTKRQRLLDAGWPSSAVPVAIVRTAFGEKHLVLVARTSEADYVLDNLDGAISPWSRVGYAWEKIQSANDGLSWRKL